MRVFTAFSGYDSQCLALNVLRRNYITLFRGESGRMHPCPAFNYELVEMAGNSIVVNTLADIFRQLFIGNFNKVVQTEIF